MNWVYIILALVFLALAIWILVGIISKHKPFYDQDKKDYKIKKEWLIFFVVICFIFSIAFGFISSKSSPPKIWVSSKLAKSMGIDRFKYN